MTPRVRVHAAEDGTQTWYIHSASKWPALEREPWLPLAPVIGGRRLSDAEVHGPGWAAAEVVVLPEVKVADVVCGCGIPPDGAPWADGCCAECGAPTVVEADSLITGYTQDSILIDGGGETWSIEAAERRALAMLAVAGWLRRDRERR